MKAEIIPNQTIVLTAPEGMENCDSLHVRLSKLDDGTLCYESAWRPSDEELQALNSGAPVILRVLGVHPPVALYVE